MKHDGPSGVQAVERVIGILRLLGEAGGRGLRLVDIQNASGLTRPTAHRLLGVLVRQRFADKDSQGRRYRLGSEFALLGWSVTMHGFDLRELCQQALHGIAQETGDTALLMVLSGYDVVCVDVKLGPYPIKTITAEVGTRRPLGLGATGLAILAELPVEEMERVLQFNRPKLKKYPYVNETLIRQAVRAARACGYAVSDGHLLPSVRGVAVPIVIGSRPVGGLAVASIRERLPKSRLPLLGDILRRHRRFIEGKL